MSEELHRLYLIFEDEYGDLGRCACGKQGFDFHQGTEWFAEHLAALAAPSTEPTGEGRPPTREQIEQAFIDGSVAGSPIDLDGNRVEDSRQSEGLREALREVRREHPGLSPMCGCFRRLYDEASAAAAPKEEPHG